MPAIISLGSDLEWVLPVVTTMLVAVNIDVVNLEV
jgi:hypothetical protein